MEYVGVQPMNRSVWATQRRKMASKSQASGDMRENRRVQILSSLFDHNWLTITGWLPITG